MRWQKYNEKLEKLMKANDFFGLGTIYYEAANFIEKEGGDPKPYRGQGYKMKLNATNQGIQSCLREDGVKTVEVLDTTDSCDTCKKLSGKKFSIQAAVENKPIPVKDCTHKYGCRCQYLPILNEK